MVENHVCQHLGEMSSLLEFYTVIMGRNHFEDSCWLESVLHCPKLELLLFNPVLFSIYILTNVGVWSVSMIKLWPASFEEWAIAKENWFTSFWLNYLDIVRLHNDCIIGMFFVTVIMHFCLAFIFKAGHGKDFFEPLAAAKQAGLKLALHLSEVTFYACLSLLIFKWKKSGYWVFQV